MIYVVLIILGLCFGSFVNALVWRLHAKKDIVKDRSECVHCHHKLAWNDLVPVFSWLLLRGKCRYCYKPISWQYPLVELAVAALFVVSYVYWPYDLTGLVEWSLLGLWLVFIVALMALLIYDLRWLILPDVIVFPLIVLGFVYAGLRLIGVEGKSLLEAGFELIAGALSIGGFYYLLYALSRGKWVGFGDVKLGIFLGVVLGWQSGLLIIMLANLLGCLVVLPGLLSGKLMVIRKFHLGHF